MADEYLWLNGAIVRSDEARISPLDRGLLYGDGLFDTMRAYGGRVHLLDRHLARLAHGAGLLGIPLPPRGELADAVRATITANAAIDAIVRITVTRGTGGSVFDTGRSISPTILIHLRPLLQHQNISRNDDGSRWSPAGEELITLSARHAAPEIGVRLKLLSYMTAIFSAPELREGDVREGLLLTDDGVVACGSVSNIFCVTRGGILRTAPLDLGVLPGITRGRVLELAAKLGIPSMETRFDLGVLLEADECFYTNAAREVVPVTALDGMPIGEGVPGPITLALADAYRAEAPDEGL